MFIVSIHLQQYSKISFELQALESWKTPTNELSDLVAHCLVHIHCKLQPSTCNCLWYAEFISLARATMQNLISSFLFALFCESWINVLLYRMESLKRNITQREFRITQFLQRAYLCFQARKWPRPTTYACVWFLLTILNDSSMMRNRRTMTWNPFNARRSTAKLSF